MKAPRSIQHRLVGMVLGVVALAWVLAVAATWLDARHELDELLDGHLAQAASLLVVQQSAEPAEQERHPDAPSLHRYAPKVAFQVFHDGRLAARSANAPAEAFVDPGRASIGGFATVRQADGGWRVFAARGAGDGVLVYVGERLASRNDILVAVLRSLLWPLVLALPLLAVALWWAVRFGLRPLHQLSAQLAQRRPDALEPLPRQDLPREIVPMVAALNGLFGRINTLIDNERSFTADAAHELRTPLAAIRTQAQVALGERDDTARRAALQRTLEGCDRAARLISQLLTLARLESGTAPPLVPVDLAAVCREVAAELAPLALGSGQALELEAGPHCVVAGDATLLRVLVRNLVDNAVRYAGPHARILVRLKEDGAGVTLSVEDGGAGLGEPERAQLGRRFYRKSALVASGSGLGWSICARICAVHGFVLEADASTALGGLRVTVSGQPRIVSRPSSPV